MKKNSKGDITYYKPLSICKKGTSLVGYKTKYGQLFDIHTKTKPIAYSTAATCNWLKILKEESNTWQELLEKANGSSGEYLPDFEAVKVIEAYIKCNAPFDEVNFK